MVLRLASDDFAEGGGGAAFTGDEIAIASSTTLTAATHGGAVLDICMTAEDQAITMFSAASITTAQRRVGFRVSPQSCRVKAYAADTTGQQLLIWLEPGSNGYLYASTLDLDGNWKWFGYGNIRNMVARRAPASMDMGSTSITANTWFKASACFLQGVPTFAVTYTQGGLDIKSILGTYDTSKVITLGSVQTIRDTAATFSAPMVAAASGGGLVYGWRDATNSKNEVVGATVSGTTLSLGAVQDVNAATTSDPSAANYSIIIPDYSTANQMWMITPMSGGSCLTVMSLSGSTVTVDGDNLALGISGIGMIHSPAANKCLAISLSAPQMSFSYCQYSGGSVSIQWSYYMGQDTATGGEGVMGISATKALTVTRNTWSVVEHDHSTVTRVEGLSSYMDSGDAVPSNYQIMYGTLPVSADEILFLDGSNILRSSMWDLREKFVQTDDVYKDERPKMRLLSHRGKDHGQDITLLGYAMHPTTKDVFVAYSAPIAYGGNRYLFANIFEVPRN